MTAPSSGWQDPNPREPVAAGNTPVTVAAGVILTLVVVATLVAVVLVNRTDSGAAERDSVVILTATDAPGPQPFTASVVVTPTRLGMSGPAQARQLPVSAQRGVRVASGLQPGLYGGLPDHNPCDAAALANYLDSDPVPAAAWATVIGVRGPEIPYYLNSLTPVILLSDTWVTSHSLVDGVAEPFQAVLQAGSAAMVDPVGVPRLHCASGAPLLPPGNDNLADYGVSGDPWSGYDPQNVVAVAYAGAAAPAAPATEFTLLDVSSGQPLVRPAGGTINLDPRDGVALPDPAAINVPPAQAGR